ncbi:DUF115 domain-containing protein [Flavobacteriales bacterium]|nr:DUF115 domain-containing protein [Flavobacteriales bacterium]
MRKLLRILRFPLRWVLEMLRSFYPKVFLGKDVVTRLDDLRGKHADEPIVLIGGGPSINKLDLSLLEEVHTVACNGFFLKMEELTWTPTYYVIEDPLPATDNADSVNALRGTTKVFPFEFRNILQLTSPEDCYVNFRRSYALSRGSNFPRFKERNEMDFFWGGTVMFFSIQLAVHLGCNPIYLIGVDLSYAIPESVRKSGAVLTSTEDDVNHFDPRYFGSGKRWHLPEVDRMQQSFNRALEYCQAHGVELINIGVDSQLKNVPRGQFEDVFGK